LKDVFNWTLNNFCSVPSPLFNSFIPSLFITPLSWQSYKTLPKEVIISNEFTLCFLQTAIRKPVVFEGEK
jgi:hypothetical protein